MDQEIWKLVTNGSKDWVTWNIDDMRMRPHGLNERRLLSNLVYSNSDCLDVWVDGVELRHGGITMSLNEKKISEDLEISENEYIIYCYPNILHSLNEQIIARFGETLSVELTWKNNINIDIEKDNAEKLFKLLDSLEENEDVQNVSSNFEVSEEVLSTIT